MFVEQIVQINEKDCVNWVWLKSGQDRLEGRLVMCTSGSLSSISLRSVQFSSVQLLSRVWLCDPMNCSTPGFPVHHLFLELAQTYVHWVSEAIQSSHSLSSPSLPAFNLCQHQGLLQWVSSSYPVAKLLEFQLQHQSFQWIFRIDFL